ncbi:MAG TPA: transglycosylase SLT domain-containing protein [Thermomicrobiales bacterium]|nr:transglycosylase SLT domain-containing protein [Thermomicrobiales bacterium]HRA32531.1 transglycosylase SLT domain-containing protein [Thermomicrobiales bacterium]
MRHLRKGLMAGTLAIVLVGGLITPVAAGESYVVYEGDTLSHIAARYGMTVRQLVALNGIDDPDLIFPGQQIVLSASGSGVVSGAEDDADEPAPAVVSHRADEEVAADESGEAPPYFPREQIRELLIDAAQRYGWDPNLIMAQAWQESSWRQDEVSWTGAVGVMQIMPRTAADMESWFFGYRVNTWDSAYDNIEMGVAYLSVLYEETGSVELALASYYQGWASVQRDGFFPDTHDYVDRIFKFREMFANGELP